MKQKSRARTNGSQNLERILRKSQPAPPPGNPSRILQESFKEHHINTGVIEEEEEKSGHLQTKQQQQQQQQQQRSIFQENLEENLREEGICLKEEEEATE